MYICHLQSVSANRKNALLENFSNFLFPQSTISGKKHLKHLWKMGGSQSPTSTFHTSGHQADNANCTDLALHTLHHGEHHLHLDQNILLAIINYFGLCRWQWSRMLSLQWSSNCRRFRLSRPKVVHQLSNAQWAWWMIDGGWWWWWWWWWWWMIDGGWWWWWEIKYIQSWLNTFHSFCHQWNICKTSSAAADQRGRIMNLTKTMNVSLEK